MVLPGVGALLIVVLARPRFGWPGLGLALASWLWHWSVVWRNRDANRESLASKRLETLGIPNWMSVMRGLLNSTLLGFLWSDLQAVGWLPAILYTVSALLDIFDGLVARLRQQTTLLGGIIDLEFDAAGVLIVVVVGIGLGQLPVWFLLVGLARYLFVWGHRWRERRNRPNLPLTASHNRRVMAGLLMGYLTVVLYPVVDPVAARVAAFAFGLPLLIGFGRDWLTTTGALDVDSPFYQTWRPRYKLVIELVTPQIGRIVALILVVAMVVPLDPARASSWVGVIGLTMVALGIVPRLGGIFLIAYAVLGMPLTTAALLLLLCALLMVQFGLRRYVIWAPEERIFAARLG